MPSIPRVLWLVLALGGVTAALAGGSPVISIGGLGVLVAVAIGTTAPGWPTITT